MSSRAACPLAAPIASPVGEIDATQQDGRLGVGARLAVIVGLSAGLWFAIALLLVAVFG